MQPIDNQDLDTDEPTTAGTRHRAMASGPDGVRPISLEDAAARIRAGRTAAGTTTTTEDGPGRLSDQVSGPEDPPASIIWVDIIRPTEADGAFLRDELHFHPLTVEDCLYGKQNPKLERYPGYFFLVLYAARRASS